MTRTLHSDNEGARQFMRADGYEVIEPFSGLVVKDEQGRNRGAVIVCNYDGHDCEIAVAGTAFVTVRCVRQVFAYIFDQLGCKRVTARTTVSNKRSFRLMRSVGFRVEGMKRQGPAGDELMMGMLRDECRIYRPKETEHDGIPQRAEGS